MIRILPLLLLLAACIPQRVERWVPVPENAGPLACTALRLEARGYTVDTTQAGVIRATIAGFDWRVVVTATEQPPGSTDPWRIRSTISSLRDGQWNTWGTDIRKIGEVGAAMDSCGYDASARFRPRPHLRTAPDTVPASTVPPPPPDTSTRSRDEAG